MPRDYFDYDAWTQYFVMQGYQVVTLNFRGSSGYGREFEEAGYGEWGAKMQNDITDTVQYFHDNGLATPEKTCIVGYSYGGYAALYGGATTPELYKCVVSGGGVSDLNKLMKDAKDDLSDESFDILLKSIGNPDTEAARIASLSPVNMADRFKVPVLLLHGMEDERVSPEHSEAMEAALKSAGKDVSFVQLEGAAHSGWGGRTSIKYLESIVLFLVEQMGYP